MDFFFKFFIFGYVKENGNQFLVFFSLRRNSWIVMYGWSGPSITYSACQLRKCFLIYSFTSQLNNFLKINIDVKVAQNRKKLTHSRRYILMSAFTIHVNPPHTFFFFFLGLIHLLIVIKEKRKRIISISRERRKTKVRNRAERDS